MGGFEAWMSKYERMDGQEDEWMNKTMDGWVTGRAKQRSGERIHGYTDESVSLAHSRLISKFLPVSTYRYY